MIIMRLCLGLVLLTLWAGVVLAEDQPPLRSALGDLGDAQAWSGLLRSPGAAPALAVPGRAEFTYRPGGH